MLILKFIVLIQHNAFIRIGYYNLFDSCAKLFINLLFFRLKEYKIFQHITFPTFLYAPTFGVVLVCIYIIILVNLRSKNATKSNKQTRQQQKEKQAVLQLVLIIIAFLIGYIPFTGKFFAVSCIRVSGVNYYLIQKFLLFYLYFYPPDSQESEGDANT